MAKTYRVTANGQVFTGRAFISAARVTAQSGDTFKVYDGIDNTGSKVIDIYLSSPNGSDDNIFSKGVSFDSPIQCDTGVYVECATEGFIYLE